MNKMGKDIIRAKAVKQHGAGKDPQKELAKAKRRQKGLVAAIIGLVVIILLLLLMQCTGPSKYICDCGCENCKNTTPTHSLELDPNATAGGLATPDQQAIIDELNKQVAEGMVNISMNGAPVFQSGTSKGNLLIVNKEENGYPEVVRIVRKDTSEEIYRSGIIPAGSKIETAELGVDLDKGAYECVAYFDKISMDTGEILATVVADILITVLS